MDRVLRNRAATIEVTFEVDGTATDPSPDEATVQIDRENGTELVAETAASEGGTGRFTYTLTPTHTSLVDVLTVTWKATISGAEQTVTTTVEVVGAHLCSLADIATELGDNTTKTAAERREARVWAEDWLEETCGVAFRTRYAREYHDGDRDLELMLRNPRPTSLRAVTISDTALSASQLSDIEVYESGKLYRAAAWTWGHRNVEITYEHGYETVPAPVRRAALKLARHYLIPTLSSYDDRATSVDTEVGNYSLITPGVRGSVTAIPEVNVVIERYGYVQMV